MKVLALTLRQPWAELVLRGKKTVDLRTWSTDHRGDLAVHASQTHELQECKRAGLDPTELTTGALVGIVRLAEVHRLDRMRYDQLKAEHLSTRRFREPLYAWVLEEPRRLQAPWPARGRLKLFHVEIPDSLVTRPGRTRIRGEDPPRNGYPFELFVVPDNRAAAPGIGYGMALYQLRVENPGPLRSLYSEGPSQGMEKVAELAPDRLRAVADEVMVALRSAGFRPTDLSATRRDPFQLPEDIGVRLGLLFLAVRPVAKVARAEAIAAGLQTMPAEEIYYWYSKAVHGPQAHRAQRALRVLLSDGD